MDSYALLTVSSLSLLPLLRSPSPPPHLPSEHTPLVSGEEKKYEKGGVREEAAEAQSGGEVLASVGSVGDVKGTLFRDPFSLSSEDVREKCFFD